MITRILTENRDSLKNAKGLILKPNGLITDDTGTVLAQYDPKELNTVIQQDYPAIITEEGIKPITFVELRGKSHYSLLDSVVSIQELIDKTEAGCGLNDHATASGLYEFNQAALKAGKKPLLGVEFYVKESEETDSYDHLVLIAKNKTGYNTLIKLVSEASYSFSQEENKTEKTRPFITSELLELLPTERLNSLIALSGFRDSSTHTVLFYSGGEELAKKKASFFKKLFGDDYYLELQDQSEDDEELVEKTLLLAEELGIKTVSTNDYHVIDNTPLHYESLELLQAMGLKQTHGSSWFIGGYNRHYHTTDEAATMRLPQESLERTIEVFNKVELFDLKAKENLLPSFIMPEGMSEKEYFFSLARKGLARRFSNQVPKEYSDRLESELMTIDSMGFNGYLLIVADFINYCKRNYSFYDENTVKRWKRIIKETGASEEPLFIGPGRGSVAGSLVAYALAITEVDPIKYDLLFERFLNPERVTMPDVDTDYPDTRRHEAIEYCRRFYDENVTKATETRVAGIATYATFQLKGLLKDLVRVLYKNVQLGETLAGLVDDKKPSLELFLNNDELIKLRGSDKRVERVVELIPLFLGKLKGRSQHAGGYVITPEAVSDYVPIDFVENKDSGEWEPVTSYTHVEENGLIKFDFLGLKSMTIIQLTLELVNKTRKENDKLSAYELYKDALVDLSVYKHLQEGNTRDVFQFNSDGMTGIIQRALFDVYDSDADKKAQKEEFFSRMIAINALYRPGPMQFIDEFIDNVKNPESIEYPVEELKPLLEKSYGLLLYQELIMSLLQTVGGFTLAGADLARRAIGKKKADELKRLKTVFIHGDSAGIVGGIKKTGRTEEELEELWELVSRFAEYGFNKSHAAAYSIIGMTCAFLSKHYPHEFAAANLNKEDAIETRSELIQYYRLRGIPFLSPSINHSGQSFTPSSEGLRFGFSSIKQVSSKAEELLKERETNGEFKTLWDFVSRCARTTTINKSVFVALTKSGALDSFGYGRKSLTDSADNFGELLSFLRKAPSGQKLLFDKEEDFLERAFVLTDEQFSRRETLANELAFTGDFISGHPTDDYKALTKKLPNWVSMNEYLELEELPEYSVVVFIPKTRVITTKRNQRMAFFVAEDSTGRKEAVVFPEAYSSYGHLVKTGNVVIANGYKGKDGKLIITRLINADDYSVARRIDYLQLTIPDDPNKAAELFNTIMTRELFVNTPGIQLPLRYVYRGKEYTRTKRYPELTVSFTQETIAFLKNLVGKERFKVFWLEE